MRFYSWINLLIDKFLRNNLFSIFIAWFLWIFIMNFQLSFNTKIFMNLAEHILWTLKVELYTYLLNFPAKIFEIFFQHDFYEFITAWMSNVNFYSKILQINFLWMFTAILSSKIWITKILIHFYSNYEFL